MEISCILAGLLTVLLVLLAARLFVDLRSRRWLPAFQVYLAALILAMLMRWRLTIDAWMGVLILPVKLTATIEAALLLMRGSERREKVFIWGAAVAFAVASLILTYDLSTQRNLPLPILGYLKHLSQVALAAFLLTMSAYAWCWHPETSRRAVLHACLLNGLWWNYAIVGLVKPESLQQWQALRDTFLAIAVLLMFLWLIAVATLPKCEPAHESSS